MLPGPANNRQNNMEQEPQQRHGVEPYTYLKNVLERLPGTTNQQVGQLTPLNWKKARQLQVRLAA